MAWDSLRTRQEELPMRASQLIAVAAAASAALLVARRSKPETLRGRTVVITGGSRGLGFALARAFGAGGANVALLARSVDQLESAAAQLEAELGIAPLTVVCDVRRKDSVQRAVATVVSQTGRIDVLVNNAGVIHVTPFAHAQADDFADSLDTHFWGPYHTIRACLPFLARHRGRIVNIASIGGRVAVPHLLPYTVGKFALVGLSEGLHAELAEHGVSVTTVCPHLMQTGSHRNALVRGQHAREATWFALGSSSRLVALDATRAARAIVEAARARRASLTLGWPARAAVLANAVVPETSARIAAAASRLLPASTAAASGDALRPSYTVNVGPVARLFPTRAARELNQMVAPDEGPDQRVTGRSRSFAALP
jgi:NAD(P)-dependent dehydrogenase (short-subunit alcohol dehydrogenase family)